MSDRKKTADIKIRLADDEKESLIELAEKTDAETISATVRTLISKMIVAYHQHGDRLIWPPASTTIPPTYPAHTNADASHSPTITGIRSWQLSG